MNSATITSSSESHAGFTNRIKTCVDVLWTRQDLKAIIKLIAKQPVKMNTAVTNMLDGVPRTFYYPSSVVKHPNETDTNFLYRVGRNQAGLRLSLHQLCRRGNHEPIQLGETGYVHYFDGRSEQVEFFCGCGSGYKTNHDQVLGIHA